MSDPRHIHLVDDDEAIRHSASFMLRHAGFRVQTFSDGPQFLAALDALPEGCVLLDVQMPEMDGLSVLETLQRRGATMPVIVLTGHGNVSVAVQAMKLGATDFVEKPYEKQALLAAIGTAFDIAETREARDIQERHALGLIAQLTPRETEVLERLVRGFTNKMIAEELEISPRTVEIHRANLMEKLETDTLSGVLRLAFAAGIGR